MTSYRLVFDARAKKEFDKLDTAVRRQFQKKLAERLDNPHVPSARVREWPNCYKIKLRKAGFRLIYLVDDGKVMVIVVAIGKRDRLEAYEIALGRLRE